MAVKIKLMRLGKIRQPYYRIVVADSRTRRSGRAIETIGKYHPKNEPSLIEIDSERAQYWLGVGALPIALARLRTGRLVASVVAHQVNNLLPGVLLALVLVGALPAEVS